MSWIIPLCVLTMVVVLYVVLPVPPVSLALLKRLKRTKQVKVDIFCPHGRFIPGVFRYKKDNKRTYSCDQCNFVVTLSVFKGEVDW